MLDLVKVLDVLGSRAQIVAIPWVEALTKTAREADRTVTGAPVNVRRAVRARAIADKALRMKLSTPAAAAVASVL